MITCFDIAKFFLSYTHDDSGDAALITNLKLQKLVYYAQGFHLALYERPLFEETIEAWTHGPVVPELYHEYKQYGSNAIPEPDEFNIATYNHEVRDLLIDITEGLGQYSGWRLVDMVHEEPPWKETNPKGIISHEKMKKYFKTQLKHE